MTSLAQQSDDFQQTQQSSTRNESRIFYAELMNEKRRRYARTKLFRYSPYPKQAEFHSNGASYRERLIMAANKFGKTECGAAEMAMHLTGLYPVWWVGKRFSMPIRAWAAGVTNDSTRDVVQEKLIGPPSL